MANYAIGSTEVKKLLVFRGEAIVTSATIICD